MFKQKRNIFLSGVNGLYRFVFAILLTQLVLTSLLTTPKSVGTCRTGLRINTVKVNENFPQLIKWTHKFYERENVIDFAQIIIINSVKSLTVRILLDIF